MWPCLVQRPRWRYHICLLRVKPIFWYCIPSCILEFKHLYTLSHVFDSFAVAQKLQSVSDRRSQIFVLWFCCLIYLIWVLKTNFVRISSRQGAVIGNCHEAKRKLAGSTPCHSYFPRSQINWTLTKHRQKNINVYNTQFVSLHRSLNLCS
jgi:hypothetical protein